MMKIMKSKHLALVCYLSIVLGLTLASGAVSLATIMVDTTPPTRSTSNPINNQVIGGSLLKPSISLVDPSGMGNGIYYQDDVTAKTLMVKEVGGSETGGTWSKTLTTPVTTYGPHAFTFTFTDQAGNTGTYTGSYTVYTQLAGTWFINNVEITAATQTIISATKAVALKFVKSVGAADTSITCKLTITAGGTGTTTLTNSAANTWTGTHTFPADGEYTVELKASDGIGNPVTMSLIQVGNAPPFDINPLQMFGLVLIAGGALPLVTGKVKR